MLLLLAEKHFNLHFKIALKRDIDVSILHSIPQKKATPITNIFIQSHY